jgi:tRNA(Arg) A34 adenosine deaminase TadA
MPHGPHACVIPSPAALWTAARNLLLILPNPCREPPFPCALVLKFRMARPKPGRTTRILRDEARIRALYRFTARTLNTARPVPFGALIVETRTGKLLMQATNAVMRENDPSSHAEVRTVRLACKKLKRPSLAGYTMYSTCEPCPMCMANALWARLDRVVYGATIADASRHCFQIHIPARQVARRSDMPCVVDGPVLRNLCVTLFTHPNMQKAFRTWSSSRTNAQNTRASNA